MSNSPSPLRPDALLVRSPDQVFGEIDGKVVLMSIENGEYYNLNAVGSRVWELLATPRSLKELVARLET